jgi:hypothetical protein
MVPVEFLASLRAYGYENEVPNVSAPMGRLLHDLVLISDTSRILELGTANGYSTIWMASALRELDTCHCEEQSDAAIQGDDFVPNRSTLGQNRDSHASVLKNQDSLRMTTSRKLITVDVSEPSYKQAIENIEHV